MCAMKGCEIFEFFTGERFLALAQIAHQIKSVSLDWYISFVMGPNYAGDTPEKKRLGGLIFQDWIAVLIQPSATCHLAYSAIRCHLQRKERRQAGDFYPLQIFSHLLTIKPFD